MRQATLAPRDFTDSILLAALNLYAYLVLACKWSYAAFNCGMVIVEEHHNVLSLW